MGSGGRRLVEDAVTTLLSQAPVGWTHLRVEFDPSAAVPVVATVTSPASASARLDVPDEVIDKLNDYRAQGAAGGTPWHTLVIDCHSDGRLSERTDAAKLSDGPRRWPVRVLAVLTALCSAAAVVVFAVGWRSAPPPPRAAMMAAPDPSPRQQQAFEVLKRWYDAENHGDGATLRALACASPGKNVADEIEGVEQNSTVQGIIHVEAVVGFRDEGERVWGRFMLRVHPITERQTRLVQEAQQHGGYFSDEYTLVQEGGELKVCDADSPPLV
ncbi:death domain-containing protein [Mycobacterium asiaticum]|uniref:death domain-containing protein n=1 Tax=Mycobacterium asiaticum TaxID=1790 RepID=UPI0007F00CA0|nr:death domain-containing protein [Mycobacterium asiaticum]OBJ64323.1 hypothetical protein A9W94_10020 [Mycobacterium asiaticum]